jgi:8-oxoguanine deaminase
MRTWIRDPLAILAPNAPRGLVVEDDRIVELVETAGPKTPCDATFDASRYVIIPGLINTHHHFFQTLTRAHPAAINKPLFPWLQALYPIWGAKLDRDNFRLGVRLALTELLMSGCTTAVGSSLCLYPRHAGRRGHRGRRSIKARYQARDRARRHQLALRPGTCSPTNG